MSRVEMANFKCPECEWTITTPFGKEDLADHIALHNAKHHNKTTRARISKTELLKLQRK
jgi:hypothetical protein